MRSSPAPSAEAVGAPTSGWWSRVATTTPTDESPAALPVPAPSSPGTLPVGGTVPEGQFLVEGTPEGATAVAAVRWALDAGDSSPSLTLAVAPGSTITPQSIVLACKAAAPWTRPDSGVGTWDTKPLVDGARCVNGVVAADASAVTFGIQALVSGTDLDVVLTPGKDPTLQVPDGVPAPPVQADRSTFRWVLPAPSGDALEVVAGSGFSEGEGNQFVPPPAAEDFDPPAAPGTPSVPVDVVSPPFDPAPVASPALEPQDLAPSVPDIRKTVRAATKSEPVDRRIGFALLLGALAMAAWSYWSSDDLPDTIGLGRFARATPAVGVVPVEPAVGGLSRFARPRTSPPTPLS